MIRLTPCGADLSVISPHTGGGLSLSCGRLAVSHATTSCPIPCRLAITGSATGSTAEMTTIRQGFMRSVFRKDEERDRRVLAGDGRDHEHVEDLVEPEDSRARVGPPERVDERAGRVQEPAGEHEQ